MHAVKQLAVAMALAASTTACTSGRPGSGLVPERAALVQVTNNNWADMVVYAVRGSSRHRLGTVTSMQTERFPLPRSLSLNTGSIALLADPVGSTSTYSTGPIHVVPGQVVDFTIQNNIRISSYAVWSP